MTGRILLKVPLFRSDCRHYTHLLVFSVTGKQLADTTVKILLALMRLFSRISAILCYTALFNR